jgi:YD repeat-containing protein
VSVPGRGPGLDLTRTYNSLNASTEGVFGYGWSSSYDERLVVNDDGSVTITEDDGSQVTAEPNGSGGFTVPSWADSTLTSSGGTYTFTRQATQIYTFNSSGQLTAISDPNGYSTTLTYSSGKLTTVTDATLPTGRTITFHYGSNGLVSEVSNPDSQDTFYYYDSSDDLTRVVDPHSNTTSFTYDSSGDHLLERVYLPNDQSGGPDAGDYLVNAYNSSDQLYCQIAPVEEADGVSCPSYGSSWVWGTTMFA